MKKQTVKKPKKAAPKKVGKPTRVKVKLSKNNPNYYSEIGKISAKKRKLDSEYFSQMAAKSHAKGCRDGYHGGRKPKGEPPCKPSETDKEE